MEKRLSHIPYTLVHIDDILISEESDEAHLEKLEAVLKVLHDSGLRLKRSKFEVLMDKVVYRGMFINSEGISPINEKAEAIWNAPTLSNVSQIKIISWHDQLLPKIFSQFVICARTTTLSSLQRCHMDLGHSTRECIQGG